MYSKVWILIIIIFCRRSGQDTGYYSDRNNDRNGYREEKGYLSDHSSRWTIILNLKERSRNSCRQVSVLLTLNDNNCNACRGHSYRQDSIRSGYLSDAEFRSVNGGGGGTDYRSATTYAQMSRSVVGVHQQVGVHFFPPRPPPPPTSSPFRASFS